MLQGRTCSENVITQEITPSSVKILSFLKILKLVCKNSFHNLWFRCENISPEAQLGLYRIR